MHSTDVYAALSLLSALGVTSYLVSKRATFLVTGDRSGSLLTRFQGSTLPVWHKLRNNVRTFFAYSHQEYKSVQGFELFTGLTLALACLFMIQLSFFRANLSLYPAASHALEVLANKVLKRLVYLPFVFILSGILLQGFSMLGMQTTFFGYGFHF